ncbi:MAG: gliding motility-associated C-terminal domain-containing protein [Prevotellaceae bacterium]|jgi:gliding motility-associated-like protein|nr:gliding motility-associated C-terminal domain-containing protein [Prevotellaceae bacterium]
MLGIKKYVFTILLLSFYGNIYGQVTTQGKDFWVSFGYNGGEPIDSVSLQVRAVATKATKIKFTFTETGSTETVSLAAGSVYTKDLSYEEKGAVYLDFIGSSQKTLHIESDENISVYAINLMGYSTDATSILPVYAYDRSYYHLSYEGEWDGYMVIAIEDNTDVYDDSDLVATLDRGEVYSDYFLINTVRHITTNKPVAYFTVHICTEVPYDVPACDCLYEQLLPESLWGTSFMIPVTIRGIERIKVYAAHDNTTVTNSGGVVKSGSLNLNKGEYVELEINRSNAGCYIESDKPVAVASYLTGLRYPGLEHEAGDPAMAWIPSIDQYVDEITITPFIASGSSILTEHHILIVTSTKNKNSTQISIGNGAYSSLSGGTWTDHPSGYSFYSMSLTNANLSYGLKNPSGLAVLGYGLGDFESYYYLAGSALRKLDASFYINDVHSQDMDVHLSCNSNVNVEAVVKYVMHPDPGHLRWFIDDVEEPALSDQTEWDKDLSVGLHKISMVVRNEYNVMDTVRSSIMIKFIDTEISKTVICQREKVELQIENAFDYFTYFWYYDGNYTDMIVEATSLEVDLSDDTAFYIKTVSSAGCISRDTVYVTVPPLPNLQVKDTAVCYGATVTLSALSSDAVSFRWYSNSDYYPGLISEEASFTTSTLKSNTAFYIEATSADGCISRDTVHVTVFPSLGLHVKDTVVCYGETVTLSAFSSAAVLLQWYSNSDYSSDGLISEEASLTTSILKSDTAFYVKAVSANNCISKDTVYITVPSLLDLQVRDTVVCYGATVTLSASSSIVASFRWYRNSNYSGFIWEGGSLTTSILKSDTAFYVEAISADGCISRDTVHVTVFPLPDLQVKDTAVCYGATVTLSALSSDAVLFQWYSNSNYSGLISKEASFTTSTLESNTAFYIETVSADNCISRDTVHVTVFPLPDLQVKDTTVCSGIMTLLTVSSQNAVSLMWFSDAAYSDAINHTSLYETALTIDTVFYIEALSDKGCNVKDVMNISVTTPPVVVAMDDVYLCYGEDITLSVLESDGTVSWNVDQITVHPLYSQDYIVTASKLFCPDSRDTVRVTVGDSLYLYPAQLPDYLVYAKYEQQIGSNAQLPTFTLVSGNLPSGLSLSHSGNISGYTSNGAMAYVFTVKVEDGHNCSMTREYILEKEFSPPKVFTPNNDGINDYFMRGYKVVIFDRLGIEIFKGDDGWDGTYKNKPAPHDIYFYKITHESTDGKIKINTGYVGIE